MRVLLADGTGDPLSALFPSLPLLRAILQCRAPAHKCNSFNRQPPRSGKKRDFSGPGRPLSPPAVTHSADRGDEQIIGVGLIEPALLLAVGGMKSLRKGLQRLLGALIRYP